MNMYDLAREITNEVMGEGTYERMHATNPNPSIQAAANHASPPMTDQALLDEIARTNRKVCVDCGHYPGEHANTADAPCNVPSCPCTTLHFMCDEPAKCPPKAWPRHDNCSECGRAVRLVYDLTDPLYVHVSPVNLEAPERCNPDDDDPVATTALRDLGFEPNHG